MRHPMTVPLALLWCGLTLSPPLVPPAAAQDYSVEFYLGPSTPECLALAEALKQALEQWSQGDKQAVFDAKALWDLLPPAGAMPFGRVLTLGQYIRKEDGHVQPIRTGREQALYDAIKAFARDQPTRTLDFGHILQMALDASAGSDGRANISIAMLTAHNVVRAMARPNQWWYPDLINNPDYDRSTDPMKDIFADLQSVEPGSLPSIMIARGAPVQVKHGKIQPAWTEVLFAREGGVFATAPGAKDAVWNGGSHYYFWIGALANHMGYTESVVGALWEMLLKVYEEQGMQGLVQLQHYGCGAAFADRVWWDSGDFKPGAPLTILGTSGESPTLNNAPAIDYFVYWEGDATAPLTVTASPVSCPPGGCVVVTRNFTTATNPLLMKAAGWCYGYSQTFDMKYELVLTDSAGHRSAPYAIIGTCLVTKAP